MRFLALHGKGTSASIFQSQTTGFRNVLGDAYTFDFVDGPYQSTPAAGIELFYNPPYYSFYDNTTVDEVRAGHDWLLEYIRDNGPYDGVICFSQGGALLSSLILYHQAETPHLPLPFKVAIFICCGAPLDCVEDVGIHVSAEARAIDEKSRTELFQKASSDAIRQLGSQRWGEGVDSSIPHDVRNVYGMNISMIPPNLIIRIPTVHVFGNQDPRYPASITLSHLCDPTLRKVYDHGGGHDIPRKIEVSKNIAELVRWSAKMASQL